MKATKSDAINLAIDFGKASGLNLDELPTPYLGSPHRKESVEAVFLNLNPGMSEKGSYGDYRGVNLDATQYFSNIDKGKEETPSGWMIKKFRDDADCGYKRFVGNDDARRDINLSCLNPELRSRRNVQVCGVKWWQDIEPNPVGGRMKWVRQIYGKADICPSKVFALELCPFHSKEWDFNIANGCNVLPFVGKRVIAPAVRAVVESKLPFAIAVGATFRAIFDNAGSDLEKNGFKAEKIEEWSCVKDDKKLIINDKAIEIIDKWPPLGKEHKKERNYKLYRVSAGNYTAVILVTWARGGNSAPADDFSDVESVIRDYVNDYIKKEHLR